MRKFFELCAGLTFIATVYVLFAALMHAIFGIDLMIKVGHGSQWIDLPQETGGMLFAAALLLLFFIFFYSIAKWEKIVACGRKNKGLVALSVVVVGALIGGLVLYVQTVDDDNIFVAVQKEKTQTIQKLIESGTDINMTDAERQNSTALHDAATWNSVSLVQFLLKNGANPNAVDNYNRTPLMVAILYREGDEQSVTEVAQALIAAGTDTSIKSTDGQTAHQLAQEKGYTTLTNILKK